MAWIKRHWRKLAILGLGIVGFVIAASVLSNKIPKPVLDLIDHHKDILKARDEAAQLRNQLGVERAEKQVREQYELELAQLDAESRERVEALKGDPEALAEAAVLAISKARKLARPLR